MIHGPDLDQFREQAKAAVLRSFVAWAEKDAIPATLRAMYVRKAAQAQLVLDGGSSPLIQGEATLRGVSVETMANIIVGMAAQGGDDLELKRMETNLMIERAESQGAIMEILRNLGIDLTLNFDLHRNV